MEHNLDIEYIYTPEGLMDSITDQTHELAALATRINQIAANLHELGMAAEMGRFTQIESAAVRLATTLDKIYTQSAALTKAVDKAAQ